MKTEKGADRKCAGDADDNLGGGVRTVFGYGERIFFSFFSGPFSSSGLIHEIRGRYDRNDGAGRGVRFDDDDDQDDEISDDDDEGEE